VSGTAGWSWLETVLAGAAVFAASSAAARLVRVRIRRPRRVRKRSHAPAFVRRVVALVGLGLALTTSPSSASGRPSAHPGRSSHFGAPWKGTGGFSPPHPLVPSEAQANEEQATVVGSPGAHPAIHRNADAGFEAPLFERAGARRARQRAESRQLHPAGQPRPVQVDPAPQVTVRTGDCLWIIAAATLGSDDPVRVDSYWRSIYRLNRAVVGEDPHRILPGQILRLPRRTTE